MAAALWNDKCHMYLMLSRIEIVIFLVHFWLFLSFPRFQSKWKYFPSYLLQKWTNVYDFCDVIMISALATIKNIRSVFEIRKNTWLYHGQPYYNLWLSVQISGCPYLEYTLTKVSFGYRLIGFMVVRRTTASVFSVVRRLFLVVSGARTTKLSNAAFGWCPKV